MALNICKVATLVYCLYLTTVFASSSHDLTKWIETTEKSQCKPIPTVVSVSSEQHSSTLKFSPPCVVLMRCGGCCNDETLTCTATETKVTKLPIMQTPSSNNGFSSIDFTEHTKCECLPRVIPTTSVDSAKNDPR
ncbi:vascular endothelial growth factor-like protein [Equine parapoxvirus]|nr:vascular endothelial growth factor-like protein [Equine parapoxvirus]